MTVLMLPAEPVLVPVLECDPAAVEAFASDLLTASAQVDDLGTFVPGTAPITDWVGDDADRYHAEVRPLGARADAMSLALRHVARRCSAHAATLQGFLDRRDDLIDRRAGLDAELRSLRLQSGGAAADEADGLQGESDRLALRIGLLNDDVATLVAEIAAEEQELVAVLHSLRTAEQVSRRYAGVADPADRVLARRPDHGAGPDAVRRWWESLSADEQYAIVGASPGSIGNLDGIPAAARDQANQVALRRDLEMLELLESRDQLTGAEREQLGNARAARDALERVGDREDPLTGEPIVSQLYLYDPTAFHGDGRVAVVAGDLDTADNLAVITPGFSNDASKVGGNTESALNLYEAARVDDGAQRTAVMAWVGYDAPDGWDGVGVLGEQMARDGGERLADAIDGLNAIRGDDPHLVAIGHSYGSTTTGSAATEHGLEVDDIVLVGSPGPGDGAQHANDLGVGADHVWVGTNSRDLIAELGDMGWVNKGNVEVGLGRDPAEDRFGAHRFEAESTTRGQGLDPLADHSKYFDHDTESLANLAQILNGDDDEVQHAAHKHDPWHGGPVDPEWERAVRGTTPPAR